MMQGGKTACLAFFFFFFKEFRLLKSVLDDGLLSSWRMEIIPGTYAD